VSSLRNCVSEGMYSLVLSENLIVQGQAFMNLHILQLGGLIMPFIFGGCKVEARNKRGIH
jgi:hypothetical protein